MATISKSLWKMATISKSLWKMATISTESLEDGNH